MKVAQILYSGLGGHGSVVFSMIDASRGEWTNALGFLGIEPLLDDYRRRCADADIAWRYFPAVEGRPWRQFRAIHDWLAAERPDAIINHSGVAVVAAAAWSRPRGIPLVHVEHTPIATKPGREWLASRVAMVLADRVVMLTPQYLAASKARLGRMLPWHKVRIIPNGIDTAIFRAAPGRSTASGGRRIGMAARFTAAKRQDLLVAVIAALARAQPEAGWSLTLAGGGEEHARVERLAARIAPGLVSFEGQLDEVGLVDWFQSLDFYVHASDGETLSTALLQAMACEVPIIASDVAGIRDLITADRGLLAANLEAEWVDALSEIAEAPDAAKERVQAARRAVEREFSARATFEAYAALVDPRPAAASTER